MLLSSPAPPGTRTSGNIPGLIQWRSTNSMAWVSQPLQHWKGPLLLCKVVSGSSHPLFHCVMSCPAINLAEVVGAQTGYDSWSWGALMEDAVAPQALRKEEATLQRCLQISSIAKGWGAPTSDICQKHRSCKPSDAAFVPPLGTTFPPAMGSGWEDAGPGPRHCVSAKGPLLVLFAWSLPLSLSALPVSSHPTWFRAQG